MKKIKPRIVKIKENKSLIHELPDGKIEITMIYDKMEYEMIKKEISENLDNAYGRRKITEFMLYQNFLSDPFIEQVLGIDVIDFLGLDESLKARRK